MRRLITIGLLLGLMALRPGVALAYHPTPRVIVLTIDGLEAERMQALWKLHLVVRVDRNGDERAYGVLAPGGSRPDVLVAEPDGTQASYADIDVDGVAGLTLIVAAFSSPRTGERLVATMVPQNGEIDSAGWHPITIRVGDTSFEGRAEGFHAGHSAESRSRHS